MNFAAPSAKIMLSERCANTPGRGTKVVGPASVYPVGAVPTNKNLGPSAQEGMMDHLLSEEARIRFAKKVHKEKDGCWIWAGKPSSKGYGRFCYGDAVYWAHRVAYFMTHGEIDQNMEIDHTCRNRLCVNPDHLEQVTSDENRRRGNRYIGQSLQEKSNLCTCGSEIKLRTSGRDKQGNPKFTRYCPACAREYRRKRWLEKRC